MDWSCAAQRWLSATRRVFPALVRGVAAGLSASLLLACSTATTEQQFSLGQPIQMGPYTFDVDRVEERQVPATIKGADGQWQPVAVNEIKIFIRILRDDAPALPTDFGAAFFDAMRIVDRAGNELNARPMAIGAALSGSRKRADLYVAIVKLDPALRGVRDAKNLGQRARDFQLLIYNPHPQKNQPGRASVQLR